VILSLCLVGFTALLDGSIVAIANPHISSALEISDNLVRWSPEPGVDCFYLSLPICAVILPVLILLLRIKHLTTAWRDVVNKVDWVGNVIFIGPITSILISFAIGEQTYEWCAWRKIEASPVTATVLPCASKFQKSLRQATNYSYLVALHRLIARMLFEAKE